MEQIDKDAQFYVSLAIFTQIVTSWDQNICTICDYFWRVEWRKGKCALDWHLQFQSPQLSYTFLLLSADHLAPPSSFLGLVTQSDEMILDFPPQKTLWCHNSSAELLPWGQMVISESQCKTKGHFQSPPNIPMFWPHATSYKFFWSYSGVNVSRCETSD